MKDAITAVIRSCDNQGKYLDSSAMDKLKSYFQTGKLRVDAATTINANAAAIVKEAVAKSLLYSDVTRPGGNMYTTRRYAACTRDLDYFMRYAVYAMMAGDPSILDERVLQGLLETYNALGVPIPTTCKAIQAMKEVTTDFVGNDAGKEIGGYFNYIINGLGCSVTDGQLLGEIGTISLLRIECVAIVNGVKCNHVNEVSDFIDGDLCQNRALGPHPLKKAKERY